MVKGLLFIWGPIKYIICTMEFDKPELIALIGIMGSVVVALWRINVSNSKKESERLANCEEMHEESQNQVINLTGEYRELKGRMDGVEKLSLSVLENITKLREE